MGCPPGISCPLGQFLGSTAGLSASVITKLTERWKAEQRVFAEHDLSSVDYVYVWTNGVHVNIRLEDTKICLLVVIGVRADERKELVALADVYRESVESWPDLLRDAALRTVHGVPSQEGARRWCVRRPDGVCRRATQSTEYH
jgi:transposase-like protein